MCYTACGLKEALGYLPQQYMLGKSDLSYGDLSFSGDIAAAIYLLTVDTENVHKKRGAFVRWFNWKRVPTPHAPLVYLRVASRQLLCLP